MKDIIQTLALLYELSLNALNSFDPKENCINFLRRLVERTLFISAFVFIKDENTGKLKLLCGFPPGEEPIQPENLSAKDFVFLDEKTVAFSLGDMGILIAHAADKLPPDYPTRFVKVIKEFAYGTKGMLALKKLEEIAYFDPLTGLFNRRFFLEEMDRLVKAWKSFSLFLIDLDNFKHINDTFGHNVGDLVIKGFADWLKSLDPKWKVGRLGGDEFGILAEGQSIKEAIRKLLKQPYVNLSVDGYEFKIAFSIGFASFPEEAKNTKELLILADTRLYLAKETFKGKSDFSIKEVLQVLKFPSEIIRIIFRENSRIYPVYQPIYDIVENKVIALEALVRFEGISLPVENIFQIAEKFGKSFYIEKQIIPHIVSHLNEIPESIKIHINISPADIYKKEFWKILENALKNGLKPTRLVMELTEREIYKDIISVKNFINNLKKLGFSVAMDDLGKGYSSLSYLGELPIDIAKIDKDFIIDLPDNKKHRSIVRALKNVCKELDITCMAEGVEKIKTLNYLRRIGIRYAQGFLFARPLKFEKVVADLKL